MGPLAEPVLLGFSSGLMCLASCGPVLLPALAATGAGWRGTGAMLGTFLAGRLVGYVGFAVLVWALGLALPLPGRANSLVFAVVHLGLAVALVLYALLPSSPRAERCAPGRVLSWRVALARRFRAVGPGVLGLLTGLNLCPPFIAAGVRAAEGRSLPGALTFFLLFFVGTAVWFLPFLGLAGLRRFTAIGTVARFAAVVVAAYYGYLGAVTLGGALLHG
jgi:hypothetical protein